MGACFSSGAVVRSFPRRAVRLQRQIGVGAYATVFLVEGPDGEWYAMKSCICQLPEHEKQTRNEIAVMRAVSHPNICALVDVGEFRDNTGALHIDLLLPLFKGGCLADFVKNGHLHKREVALLALFREICEGVRALHSSIPPLAHRDIKPENVMLTNTDPTVAQRPVLIDFGSVAEARQCPTSFQDAQQLEEHCAQTCSMLYRAPELHTVERGVQIDEKTDIWSLGCLLHFMICGEGPFDDIVTSGGSMKLAVLQPRAAPPQMDSYSAPLRGIYQRVLTTSPSGRPCIDDVIADLKACVPA